MYQDVISFWADAEAVQKQYRNVALLGKSGTGKSTVGDVLGKIYGAAGFYLRVGETRKVEASELSPEFTGQVRAYVRTQLNGLLEGTIFLDEAYALNEDRKNPAEDSNKVGIAAVVAVAARAAVAAKSAAESAEKAALAAAKSARGEEGGDATTTQTTTRKRRRTRATVRRWWRTASRATLRQRRAVRRCSTNWFPFSRTTRVLPFLLSRATRRR